MQMNDRYTAHFPRPGETVQGKEFAKAFGGTGANVCVAAGRLGPSVALLGKVPPVILCIALVFYARVSPMS